MGLMTADQPLLFCGSQTKGSKVVALFQKNFQKVLPFLRKRAGGSGTWLRKGDGKFEAISAA